MIEVKIDKRMFNERYLQYLNDTTKTQIFYGGSSSGKSFYIAQRVVIDIANGGRNYLVVRKTANSTRKSVVNEILKAIDRFQLTPYFRFNKSDGTITHANGNQILFAGLDDTERIKSISPMKGIITDIWIEEATETDYQDVKQLYKRLRGKSPHRKRIIMTFNPILRTHWIYREYFGNWKDDKKEYRDKNVLIVHTTYKDNNHLTQEDIDELENESDPYYFNVYTLGQWGVLGEVIFKNWTVQDLSEIRSAFDRFNNGLDFGFSVDPSALIRMHYDRKHGKLYILDEIYETELTNDALAEKAKEIIGTEYVTADSAEPKSIRELQQMGLRVIAAKKGKDSVNFGIGWLKKQQIIIDSKCVNTKREFELAQWKKDKHGNVMSVPVDRDNHALDAIRYGCEDLMIQEDAILF